MDIMKRIRPGSKATAPVSETRGTKKKGPRRGRSGMSAPGANQSVEGQSYPVGFVAEVDASGVETRKSAGAGIRHLLGEAPDHENITEEDPTGWGGPYEADRRDVVAKLFGIVLNDD